MLLLSVRLAATIHNVLRTYAPTNVLLDWLRTRRGLNWAIPVALVLVPAYLFGASIATTVIEDGGPGWLNILVLLFVWNAIKFALMVPVSAVLLLTLPRSA